MYWGKLVSITSASQIGIQAIGFLSGILIIRFLSVNEYAYYTLANTVLGTLMILSDGGISSGVISQGGKVWKDKEKLGAVLATGLHLRQIFALGSLVISMPILAYLLMEHNASWLTILMICASVIPAFYASLSDSLLVIVPKLHQCILPIQKNHAKVEVGRLGLMLLFIIIFPFTYVALLANGIPRIYGNIKLKKIAKPFANISQKRDPEIEKKILAIVKRFMPGAIYYCISGQITIWLISFFGNSNSVAQIGALTRLSMLLMLFQYLLKTFIEPRFARMELDKNLLVKWALQVFVVIIVLLILLVLGVYVFSSPILQVLGEDYSHLHEELLLSIIGACLLLLAHTALMLYLSKGWVLNPFISVGISLFSIGIGALLFDVSTLKGVLVFNIFLAIVEVFLHWIYFTYKLRKVDS